MLTVIERAGGPNRQKPQAIVRGPACRFPWAWDGLMFAVPFIEASPEGRREIVANVLPTTVSGLFIWRRDERGNPAADIGDDGYLEYADNPQHDRATTELTVYARFKKIGPAESGSSLVGNVHTNNDNPYVTWCMGENDPATGKLMGAITTSASGTPVELSDTTTLSSTQWVSGFLRWRTGSPLRLDVISEYGQPLSGITGGANVSGTLTYAAGMPMRVNCSDAITKNYTAYYSQVLAWSRRLTDAELTCLVMDPFGWYSARRESIVVAAPFPVGPGMAAQGMTMTGPGGWS